MLLCGIGFSGTQAQIYEATSTKITKRHIDKDLISIKFGGSLPLGDYASTSIQSGDYTCALFDNFNTGAAKLGLTAGLAYTYYFNEERTIGLVTAIDYIRNGLNDKLEISAYETLPTYSNIPATLGLSYTYPVVEDIVNIYGEAGIGLNYRMISDYTYNDGTYATYSKIEYDNAISFAFRAGIGAILYEHLTVSLDYYGLGSADVDGYQQISTMSNYFDGGNLNQSALLLRIGVCF